MRGSIGEIGREEEDEKQGRNGKGVDRGLNKGQGSKGSKTKMEREEGKGGERQRQECRANIKLPWRKVKVVVVEIGIGKT